MSGGDVGERGKALKDIAKIARFGEAMRRIEEVFEEEGSIDLEEVGVVHCFTAGSQRRVVISVIASQRERLTGLLKGQLRDLMSKYRCRLHSEEKSDDGI